MQLGTSTQLQHPPSQLSRWPCVAVGVVGGPPPLPLPLAPSGGANSAAAAAAALLPGPAGALGRSCISCRNRCAASRAERALTSSAERTLSNQGWASAWRAVMRRAGS